VSKFLLLPLFVVMISLGGCVPETDANFSAGARSDFGKLIYDARIVGLSEIVEVDEYTPFSELKVYVDVIGSEGEKTIAPAIFRFELYSYEPYVTGKKGSRIYLWKDIDLIDPKIANDYWHDIFSSFEFSLTLPKALLRDKYILAVTVISPIGERVTVTNIVQCHKIDR